MLRSVFMQDRCSWKQARIDRLQLCFAIARYKYCPILAIADLSSAIVLDLQSLEIAVQVLAHCCIQYILKVRDSITGCNIPATVAHVAQRHLAAGSGNGLDTGMQQLVLL